VSSPSHRRAPIIGRGGVNIVAADIAVGLLALPFSAALRIALTPVGPGAELERPALWATTLLSVALWPLAIRTVDAGYPSTRIGPRRMVVAALLWILAVSGSIFLLDKSLESRALVVIAALIVLAGSLSARTLIRTDQPSHASAQLPDLGVEAERALTRGEPISIDLTRIEYALARPTVIFEAGAIWIYPSVLGPSERLVKRIIDVVLATSLLLVALIPMALIALAIAVKEGRPVLYSDRRAGLFGRPFNIRKFRTMRVGADREREALWARSATSGPAFKIEDDPRVTGIGRFLRRYSLDELPQLLDVLSGRMSLIGPRPAGLDELARYDDRHRLRLTVRPGVTGLWQVRRRLDDDFEQRMADDLEYIRRWSPLLDLSITLRTIAVVLSGRGV
jgi:lipopolysaccharide/colanic/teichoic acid biosynthesis glycosyltransferase